MTRKILATTAVAMLVATAAYAQEQPAPAPADPLTTQPAAPPAEPPRPVQADAYLASNFIGESVYNGTGDNFQTIGDVNDIVIDAKGQVKSIIIGVGGFLGLGEKNVAIDFPKLSWMEANGDRWLLTDASKEQLEAMAEFDRTPYQPAPAEMPTGSIAPAPTATTPQQ